MKWIWESGKKLHALLLALATIGVAVWKEVQPGLESATFKSAMSFAGGHWTSFALAAVTLYWIVDFIRTEKMPLSVVSSKIVVTFNDPEGRSVDVYREQFIRARRPNVTASLMEFVADYGSVMFKERDIEARVADWAKERITLSVWRRNKSVQMVHLFDAPLPFPAYSPFIPDWVIGLAVDTWGFNELPSFLRSLLLYKRTKVTYRDEYAHEDAYQQFSAGLSDHKKIRFIVNAPDGVNGFDVQAMRIVGVTAAVKVAVDRDENGDLKVKTSLPPGHILRFSWRRQCGMQDCSKECRGLAPLCEECRLALAQTRVTPTSLPAPPALPSALGGPISSGPPAPLHGNLSNSSPAASQPDSTQPPPPSLPSSASGAKPGGGIGSGN